MENLYALVQCLTSAEWHSLQNYLSCFSTHNQAQLKQLQLAKLLKEPNACPSHQTCCLKIYGVKKDARFDVLKSALKEKILDFLLTDISSNRQSELDKLDQAYIKIKKLSAQYKHLFHSKPKPALCYDVLDEIISLAKEYEHFPTAVEFLHEKRVGYLSLRKGAKEFEEISSELNKYIVKQQALMKAEQYYHHLMMLYDYNGKCDKKKVNKFLTTIISEVSHDYWQTKSPRINYYLKIFEMDYYQLNENHLKARSTCLELLTIVRNNKSVYRKQRVGVVYDHLSRCEYYLGNYKQAAEWAREAQKHFNLGSDNYCVALEQEFYALFAQSHYEPTIEVANKMLNGATQKELGNFRYSKYNVLLANAFFRLGKYNAALNILSHEHEISKDKAGWETGLRILKIMTLIELNKSDEASLAVLNLKQFFKYIDAKDKSQIRPRDKKILNLLLIAERNGFLFSGIPVSQVEKYLSPLHSNDADYRWEPFTHELIPFHEWFKNKCKIHKIAPYKAGVKKISTQESIIV